MRKHLRQIARANMQREGIQHPHKRTGNGKSFFSENWREYVSNFGRGERARAAGSRGRSPRRR